MEGEFDDKKRPWQLPLTPSWDLIGLILVRMEGEIDDKKWPLHFIHLTLLGLNQLDYSIEKETDDKKSDDSEQMNLIVV